MSAGVSPIQTFGLDLKLPEMLMACMVCVQVFHPKSDAHGKLLLREVCIRRGTGWELSFHRGETGRGRFLS